MNISKYMLVILLCLLLFGLGFLFDINRLQQQLTRATKQQSLLEKQLYKKQQLINNATKYKAQLAALKTSFAAYKPQLQQRIGLSTLANSIAHTANNHGAHLNSILPKKPETANWLLLHPIQITATGNYHQLIAFINALNQLPYFMVLQEFSLKPVKQDHTNLALKALVVVYSEDKQ